MLDPMNPFHKLLGHWLFQLPYNQKRWYGFTARFLPILQPAFRHNAPARLLVMKALQQIDKKDIDSAQHTIEAIIPVAREGDTPDQALVNFLWGLGYLYGGNTDRAIEMFKIVNKYQHRFFMPYMMTADYNVNVRRFYNRAEQHYQTAIDCIYEFPPLTDTTRNALCIAHAGLCFCRIMMHRLDEAQSDLLHAEQMGQENKYTLHARAYLHAALHHPEEARAALSAFKKHDPEGYSDLQERIERILADEDPHFTPLPIGDPEAISAFWQTFLEKENDILQLLVLGDGHGAMSLIKAALEHTDPDDVETLTYYLKQTHSENRLYFGARFSRTNNALIDQLLAACPQEVHKRWHIIREL